MSDIKIDLSKFSKIKKNGKKSEALGKGISALLADASFGKNLTNAVSNVINIDMDKCYPSRYQARKDFNNEELYHLAESIKQKGVIQPILVRKDEKNNYEIIAGERRYRASKLANLETIPAIEIEADEIDVMEIGLIENLQRKDLNPIEEAQSYKNLLDLFNYNHEDIGKLVGKSRSYITNYLRILNLPISILDLIQQGKLSAGHAKMLVSSDNPKELANKIVKSSLSVRETENILKETKKKNQKQDDLDQEAFILLQNLKMKYPEFVFSIQSNAKKNHSELKIKYKNIEDIKNIFKV